MTRCALCGWPCIPMADYNIPVCARCDADYEDRMLRRLATQPKPPQRKGLAEWAAQLSPSFRSGPGDPAAIAELVAAFDSKPGRRGVS